MVPITANPKMIFITAGFMLFDILSGTLAAFAHSELNSTKAREGLFHKVSMLALIAFGVFLDSAQYAMDFGIEVPTCAAICTLIIVTELYSIVENFAKMLPDELGIRIIELFHMGGNKFDYLYCDDEDSLEGDPYE